MKKLEFDWVPFEEFYLVPGGRFLITFDELFLRIWSLYPQALWDGASKVRLTSSYHMQHKLSGIAFAGVVDDTKLQILVFGTTELVTFLLNCQIPSRTIL